MKYINNIAMVNGYYLVKPTKVDVKFTLGLVLEIGLSRTQYGVGIVMATPSENSLGLNVGDLVYYDKYDGINIRGELSADDYSVLTEKQILAYVPKSKHDEN
jgi:co-chaperonin GroES (HSP10)